MNILLLLCTVVTVLLFFAGKRKPKGLCHLLSPIATLLTLVLAISRLVAGTDDRLASGSDYVYLDAKAAHLAQSITALAAKQKLAGHRILILRPEAPDAQSGLSDEVQRLIDQLRQQLPAEWELISKEALEVNAKAVTCSHFDRAIKGERYDVLLSFIGLPQDLDNCAESACFSPGSHEGKLVVVGGGSIDDFHRALEMNLFDSALLPLSQAKLKLGGHQLNLGSQQAIEFITADIPKAELSAAAE
jgi:hypothetical protein